MRSIGSSNSVEICLVIFCSFYLQILVEVGHHGVPVQVFVGRLLPSRVGPLLLRVPQHVVQLSGVRLPVHQVLEVFEAETEATVAAEWTFG